MRPESYVVVGCYVPEEMTVHLGAFPQMRSGEFPIKIEMRIRKKDQTYAGSSA